MSIRIAVIAATIEQNTPLSKFLKKHKFDFTRFKTTTYFSSRALGMHGKSKKRFDALITYGNIAESPMGARDINTGKRLINNIRNSGITKEINEEIVDTLNPQLPCILLTRVHPSPDQLSDRFPTIQMNENDKLLEFLEFRFEKREVDGELSWELKTKTNF